MSKNTKHEIEKPETKSPVFAHTQEYLKSICAGKYANKRHKGETKAEARLGRRVANYVATKAQQKLNNSEGYNCPGSRQK